MGERLGTVEAIGIQPLTIDQVDWRLFSLDSGVRERMRQLRLENPLEFFDFSEYGKYLLRKARGERKIWGHPNFEMDEAVKTFLGQNRPPRVFYKPEDLPQILQGQDELVLKNGSMGDMLYWGISFAAGSSGAEIVGGPGAARFSLTRPNFRGKDNDLRCFRSQFCPYLEAFYVADYQNGRMVFRPKLMRDYLTDDRRGLIEKRLLKLLGVRSVFFPAKLNFEVVDPDAYKIMVAMGEQNA